ncbi:MAG: ABC transporter ATP-binding protein [Calditrichota bacterium]
MNLGGSRAFARGDSVTGQAFDARLMKRLLGFLKPYLRQVAGATILLFIAVGVDLTIPLIIKRGIDHNITPRQMEGLGKVVLWLMAALVAAFILRFIQSYITQWIGQKAIYDIRSRLFNHLQRQDLKFIDSRPVGWLMTRITGDIQTLYEMFAQGVVSVFGDLLMLLGIVVVLLVMNVRLAVVTFVVVPLLFWAVFLFRSRVRVTFRIIRESLAKLNGFIQEHISGIRTIQLFSREKAASRQFHELNLEYQNAFLRAIHYFALFFPAVTWISALATALILLVGGLMIRSDALTWGALVAFIQYSERFFRPIRDLSERYNTMQAAMAAAERVFWLLDTHPEVTDPKTPVGLTKAAGEIVFDRVSFAYNPNEPVLKEVSFTLKPGETVAVVGVTGAGKTTLISLLLRFWEVSSGRILLDGTNIRDFRLKDLRRQFGVVQQDVFMFSGSVADNVTWGDNHRGDIDLRRALAEANALDFVERLPNGIHEPVGERGAMLSGGQKQLLAIARALAADPPILLLDEATSAVDTETEQRIQEALQRLMKGRTTLVVAHRLSTIRNADRIVVMHKGCVRESGTHEELLACDGIYARLYHLQFAGTAV